MSTLLKRNWKNLAIEVGIALLVGAAILVTGGLASTAAGAIGKLVD